MLYVISKLCLRFSTTVCDTQFTLILFFSDFFGLMFNLKGPQGQNPTTTCGPRTRGPLVVHGPQFEKRWFRRYGVLVSDWTGRGSNPVMDRRLLSRTSRPALGPTQPPMQWVPGFFPGSKAGSWVMRLTTHLNLAQRLNLLNEENVTFTFNLYVYCQIL